MSGIRNILTAIKAHGIAINNQYETILESGKITVVRTNGIKSGEYSFKTFDHFKGEEIEIVVFSQDYDARSIGNRIEELERGIERTFVLARKIYSLSGKRIKCSFSWHKNNQHRARFYPAEWEDALLLLEDCDNLKDRYVSDQWLTDVFLWKFSRIRLVVSKDKPEIFKEIQKLIYESYENTYQSYNTLKDSGGKIIPLARAAMIIGNDYNRDVIFCQHSAVIIEKEKAMPKATKKADIQNIQSDRGKTYGEWDDNAKLATDLCRLVQEAIRKNPREFLPGQIEGIEMALRKIARICNGDPGHLDSWLDAESYLNLGRQSTEKAANG